MSSYLSSEFKCMIFHVFKNENYVTEHCCVFFFLSFGSHSHENALGKRTTFSRVTCF